MHRWQQSLSSHMLCGLMICGRVTAVLVSSAELPGMLYLIRTGRGPHARLPCERDSLSCMHIAHHGLFTFTHTTVVVFIGVIAAVPVTYLSISFLLTLALFLLLLR